LIVQLWRLQMAVALALQSAGTAARVSFWLGPDIDAALTVAASGAFSAIATARGACAAMALD
jgi:hypothetical protein